MFHSNIFHSILEIQDKKPKIQVAELLISVIQRIAIPCDSVRSQDLGTVGTLEEMAVFAL